MSISDWSTWDWIQSGLCLSCALYVLFNWASGLWRGGGAVAAHWERPHSKRVGWGLFLVWLWTDMPGLLRTAESSTDLRIELGKLLLTAIVLPTVIGRNTIRENGIIFQSAFTAWSAIRSASWNDRGQLVIHPEDSLAQPILFDVTTSDRDAVDRLIADRLGPNGAERPAATRRENGQPW